ncbi:hypothetical protein AM676_004055 [Escherichia coli]|nr:hypothetical protein [Escherichia coli]
MKTFIKTLLVAVTILFSVFAAAKQVKLPNNIKYVNTTEAFSCTEIDGMNCQTKNPFNYKTVFCKNGDITNPELSGGKMPDAGRNMTWDLRAPAPTPSHLRATVAIKGSFRGAEF